MLRRELEQARSVAGVGRLAVGIAHDFANVLTAVVGRADLLLEDPDLSDTAREEATQLRAACERGVALARDLLRLGRGEPDQAAVVDDAILGLEPLLRRVVGDRVSLTTVLGAADLAVPLGVSAIAQIVLNLALNSRDAMPDGGSLEIRTACLADAACQFVLLAVRDTGTGMCDETRRRAFDPFFTTKYERGGTGVGLATVQSLVTSAGGSVALDSRVGVGTVVTVRLPTLVVPSMLPAAELSPA